MSRVECLTRPTTTLRPAQKHRALWREGYSRSEATALRELCRASRERRIRFVYALSPGLEKGVGEFGKLLALPQGLLGHLQILLGLDQPIEGLGHRKSSDWVGADS